MRWRAVRPRRTKILALRSRIFSPGMMRASSKRGADNRRGLLFFEMVVESFSESPRISADFALLPPSKFKRLQEKLALDRAERHPHVHTGRRADRRPGAQSAEDILALLAELKRHLRKIIVMVHTMRAPNATSRQLPGSTRACWSESKQANPANAAAHASA
jgi:hypothetical protein